MVCFFIDFEQIKKLSKNLKKPIDFKLELCYSISRLLKESNRICSLKTEQNVDFE